MKVLGGQGRFPRVQRQSSVPSKNHVISDWDDPDSIQMFGGNTSRLLRVLFAPPEISI